MLYILAGLPGSGKTTLAQALAPRLGAAHLRIDTIEQALHDLCGVRVEAEGYRLAYRVAADMLRAGASVVADSCNPIELTRRAWEQVAVDAGVRHVNVEIVCSDAAEHRRRVEQRGATVPGLRLPTWPDVEAREYHAWTADRIVIDTAGRLVGDCVESVLAALAAPSGGLVTEADFRDTQFDRGAIDAIRRQLEAAENAGDALSLSALLAADAVAMVPDFPVQKGREACTAFFRDVTGWLREHFERRITYASEEIVVDGSLAWDRGTFSASIVPHDGGEASTMTGKYLWLLRREASGGWRIARLIVSRDEEPHDQAADG